MSALQSTVRRSVARAFIGQIANTGDPRNLVVSAANKAPLRAQVGTITVDTATDLATYAWTINGIAFSLVAATSETTTTIAAKIADAINAEPAVRGQVKASAAAAVVTLTGVYPGVTFTASDADAKLTTVQASTSALEAASFRPGLWACLVGPLGSTAPDIDGDLQGVVVAASANLTAQVAEWTYTTFENTVVIGATVNYDGKTYAVDHASATDAATSAGALRAKLGEALDGLPLTVGGTGADISITATAGAEFAADIFFATAASTGVLTETANLGARPGTSLAFGGIVERHLSSEDDATGLVYPGVSTVPVCTSGKIWAALAGGSTPSAGGQVFVYVGSTTADQGKIYSAAGTDRLALSRDVARFTGRSDTTDGVTLVEINVTAR